jgi:hypothetical protein
MVSNCTLNAAQSVHLICCVNWKHSLSDLLLCVMEPSTLCWNCREWSWWLSEMWHRVVLQMDTEVHEEYVSSWGLRDWSDYFPRLQEKRCYTLKKEALFSSEEWYDVMAWKTTMWTTTGEILSKLTTATNLFLTFCLAVWRRSLFSRNNGLDDTAHVVAYLLKVRTVEPEKSPIFSQRLWNNIPF